MKRWIGYCLGILLGCYAQAGGTCTRSFTNLNFGTYTSSLIVGTNQVTETCDSNDAYIIGLNAGTGSGATTTTRKMTTTGGLTLSYQLFQDSARTRNWGNTTGVDTVTGVSTGQGNVYTIYAQILSGQSVTPGTYTDTIASSTGSFTVTAIVQANCTLSATALAFGTYMGSLLNQTSSLTINCSASTSYTIGLGAGTSTGATVTSRAMTGPGSARLGYSLFSNSGRTVNWGLTANTVAGSGNGSPQTITVYGQIPAGTPGPPGTYSDTITATITY